MTLRGTRADPLQIGCECHERAFFAPCQSPKDICALVSLRGHNKSSQQSVRFVTVFIGNFDPTEWNSVLWNPRQTPLVAQSASAAGARGGTDILGTVQPLRTWLDLMWFFYYWKRPYLWTRICEDFYDFLRLLNLTICICLALGPFDQSAYVDRTLHIHSLRVS